MAPFRFRLQKLLEYRERREDEAKLALAQAEGALANEERRLAALEDERRAARSRQGKETHSAADSWLWQHYLRRLDDSVAVCRRRLDELAALIAFRRQELLQRATERKLLEQLRHRHLIRHTYEEMRRDQCTLDETATLAYCRRDS